VSGRDENVPEPAVLVELELVGEGADAGDARTAEARVPAGLLAKLGDVLEEGGDGRVVPVDERLQEGNDGAVPNRLANGEPGERRREAVTVALRAHTLLADRRRAHAPRSRGIRVGPEDEDLARLDPAVAERRLRGEPGEAAADDRDPVAR
jgi:hypothetical protein